MNHIIIKNILTEDINTGKRDQEPTVFFNEILIKGKLKTGSNEYIFVLLHVIAHKLLEEIQLRRNSLMYTVHGIGCY